MLNYKKEAATDLLNLLSMSRSTETLETGSAHPSVKSLDDSMKVMEELH